MDIPTHSMLPVIVTRLICGKDSGFKKGAWWSIAIAGAMPDLINPHITLEARQASWSHGLPFWVGLTVVLMIAAAVSRGCLSYKLAGIWSGAYLLHMICDSISGGINWLYPWKDFIWGKYWISFLWWIPLDAACALICYWLFRLQPILDKRQRTSER
jgi:LexA-binding, inner membrane-associated putative hydrolase